MSFKKNFNIKKVVLCLIGIIFICYGISFLIFTVFGGSMLDLLHKDVGIRLVDTRKNNYNINSTKTMNLNGIDEICVNVSEANLKFYNGKENEIKASVNGNASATGIYKKPELKCYKSGSTLYVELIEKHQFHFSFNSNVNMNVYIPNSYKNNIKITTSSGDVKVDNYNFKNFDCELKEGKLNISNINTDKFNYKNSSGDMDSNNITAKTAYISSSEGNVKLNGFNTDTFNYKNRSGDLKGYNIQTKSTTIDSSEGTVSIIGFSGDLQSSNRSGDTDVEYSKFNNNVNITSSEGQIKLRLPGDSKFNIDADTNEGKIECGFPINVSEVKDEEKLNGKIGDSTNQIKLRNSSGDISINK